MFCDTVLFSFGVIAQLVERLNGIEEVWGSNPHGSMSHKFIIAGGVIRMGQGRFIAGTNPHASMVDHRIRALLVCGEIPL